MGVRSPGYSVIRNTKGQLCGIDNIHISLCAKLKLLQAKIAYCT
jgi:hypothetical protein